MLDLDSPKLRRFDAADQRGLEALAKIFIESAQELRSTTENAGPSSLERAGSLSHDLQCELLAC